MEAGQETTEAKEFAWTRLEPAEPDRLLYGHSFSVFLVQVKSESEMGERMADDPLAVLREQIGIEDDADMQATALRVNAAWPWRPVHRSEVWMVYPRQPSSEGSRPTAVGVQYKYETSQT